MNVNLTANFTAGSSLAPKAANSRNVFAEAGLLLLVAILFWWFLIQPKQAAVNAQKSNLAQLNSQESQMSSTVAAMTSLVSKLNGSSQQVGELDQALPLSGNPLRLQLLVQSLAQSSGVTVTNVSVSAEVSGEVAAGDKTLLADPFSASRTLQTLSGTAAVGGSYSQIIAFLQKLEDSGRLIDISSLSLNSGINGGLDLELGFKGYYFAPLPAS